MGASKTWMVLPASGQVLTVEADRLELSPEQARATFYVGDDVVASFVGYMSVYPVPSATPTPE